MKIKAGHYEFIAREGFPFFVPLLVVSAICWIFGLSVPSFVLLILGLCTAAFFRNPQRNPPTGDDLVLSPADGTVVQLLEDTHSEHIPETGLKRISIFMSVFNVHINRWPINGTVRKITHISGRFLDARDPDASAVNEHNSIVVQKGDAFIEVVQIAGKVARRIACWVNEGDEAHQGERFGLIRFGSRLDVYLPKEFAFTVKIGEKVRSGETVIAKTSISG